MSGEDRVRQWEHPAHELSATSQLQDCDRSVFKLNRFDRCLENGSEPGMKLAVTIVVELTR